jgi:uncharacterized cupredoxin-like copper-binding protein
MENKQEKKGIFVRIYEWFKNLTVKGLLGAIFIAFVIIILLMSVSYLPSALSRISSSFSAALYSVFVPAEGATMTADKKIVESGEDFNITFKMGDAKDGIFTVFYDCEQDVKLMSIENNGLKNISCDTPYYLLNNDTSIRIRAISEEESIVRLVITGALENNETLKSETVGVARITVKNDSLNAVSEETTTTRPATSTNNSVVTNISNFLPRVTPVTPVAPTYYGKADLAVRVLQVGRLNTATNQIFSQTTFSYGDTVGVKFEVRNDGDAATTGYWNFTAALPSLSNPSYTSPSQVSLRPGESIQFTLGFNNLTNQRSSLITINVDPANTVVESNEGNNMTTSSIINTDYNNNYYNNNNNYYNNNYNYNNGCYVNGYFTYNCLGYDDDYYDDDYYGDEVDLEVEIIAVGYINSSGRFVEDNEMDEGDDAAVKFKVRNLGDDESGRWDYEVDMTPSFSGDTYERRNMSSLDPGESITITVEFNNAEDTGTNRFRVEVDPDDDIGDDRRSNNDDSATIRIN